MTLTDTEKAKISRWLGFTAEVDDFNEIDARVATLAAYPFVEQQLKDLICRLSEIEDRIWQRSLPVPHVKMYFLNVVEGRRLLSQISKMLALPLRSGMDEVWSPELLKYLVPVASPAETPFISLPAINFEYCDLVECPIESDVAPKYPAVGQVWREISQNVSWKWDGLWWRGITAGKNHWHENIGFEKVVTLSTTPIVTRQVGSTLPKVGSGLPIGYCIEQVRTAIAYDNARSNSKAGSGVTAVVGAGIVKSDGTTGRSGRKLQGNVDTFQKPGAQSPPAGVSTAVTEVWTDQIPPDLNNPDSARGTVGSTNTAVPGSYLVNGAQGIGTVLLNVDTGSVAPQAGTIFTIGSDTTVYTVSLGATTTSWPISPALVAAAADNAVIVVRGSSISNTNNTRTAVQTAATGSAGTTTYAGGKTATIARNTRDQSLLATGDYSHVTSSSDVYEYFYPLTGFDNFGVEILAAGTSGEVCHVAGRVNFSVSALKAGG